MMVRIDNIEQSREIEMQTKKVNGHSKNANAIECIV
jgi:hypothetical protein